MIMNEDAIERLAYRLIRRETRRFNRTTSDSELANYVRGVVDLQTELYGEFAKQENGMKSEYFICDKCGYDYDPGSEECYKCVKSESEDNNGKSI